MANALGNDAVATTTAKQSLDAAKVANQTYTVNFTIGTYEFKALGIRKMVKLISEGFNLLHLLSAMDTDNEVEVAETLAVFLQNDEVFFFVKKFIYQSIGETEDKFGDDLHLVDISEVIVACKNVYDVATLRQNFILAGIPTPQALVDFLNK